MTSARLLTKKELGAELASYLERLSVNGVASLIGKGIYQAHNLGLSLEEGHKVVRRHLRKHGNLHETWWTKQVAEGAWKFAEEKQASAS